MQKIEILLTTRVELGLLKKGMFVTRALKYIIVVFIYIGAAMCLFLSNGTAGNSNHP